MGEVRIGDLATRSGLSVKSIRYYEQIDVLDRPEREPNGYRDYPPAALDRLAFVRAAQSVGFSLGEIREVIAFRERGDAPCSHVLALIERHADDLTEKIASLERVRADLVLLARRGRRLDPADCKPATICHVIPTG